MRALVLLLASVGCRQVLGLDDPATLGDARTIDARPVDSGPLGMWGPPQVVNELRDPAGVDDPCLTADQLEIFFGSGRAGGVGAEDVWTATRAATSLPWSNLHSVTELSTAMGDSNPRVTPDGLLMYFTSNRVGSNDYDIYVASRATRTASWSVPSAVSELNSGAIDTSAAPSADATKIWFGSNRIATNNTELYQASRASTALPFGPPARIAELSTASTDVDPWSPNAGTLYFSSDRTPSFELYVARQTGGVYTSVSLISELGSSALERDPWVSADERTIYFMSDRLGQLDIFMAQR